jgi:ribosome-binding factor A
MVTITDARVTPDLREATVYYTVYGDDEARQATAQALESAKGVLRSTVGKQTGVRYTPSLAFIADHVPEHAAAIDDLLVVAREQDARVQEIAATAAHAGETDPYRAPRVEPDEAEDAEA